MDRFQCDALSSRRFRRIFIAGEWCDLVPAGGVTAWITNGIRALSRCLWLVGWLFYVPATLGRDPLKRLCVEVADPTCSLSQSKYTYSGPTRTQ